MALLSYGETLGLAYVHDFKGYNDEMARQEQMTAAKKAQDTQKSMWVADKLKLGKTFTKYDSDELKKFALERYEKVGKIVNSNEWETNPMALAIINQNAEELLDNEHVQRSSRVHQAQQMLIKDLSDPKYADDEDAAELMKLKLQEFSNYDKQGNGDGVEGAPVKEFTYTSPSLFNLNDRLNEISKFAGKRTGVWNNGAMYGTEEYIANLDNLAIGEIEGVNRRKIEKEYQRYLSSPGSKQTTKLEWLKEGIKERVSLDKSAAFVPGYGTKSSGDSEDGQLLNQYNAFVAPGLQKNMNNLAKSGQPFLDLPIANSQVFISNSTPINPTTGKGSVMIPSNEGLHVFNSKTGKVETIKSLGGSTYPVQAYGAMTTIMVGGQPRNMVKTRMIVDAGNNSEFSDKLLAEEGFFFKDIKPKEQWGESGGIQPYTDDDGNVIKGKYVINGLLPADLSEEKQMIYNGLYNSPKDNNTVTIKNIETKKNMLIFQDRIKDIPVGQPFIVNDNGTKRTAKKRADGSLEYM